MPKNRQPDSRRAEQIVSRAGDEQAIACRNPEFVESEPVRARIGLVEARPLGGDDRIEASPGAGCGEPAQRFGAVGDDRERKFAAKAADQLAGFRPGLQLAVTLDQPVGDRDGQAGGTGGLTQESLVRPVAPFGVGQLQVDATPAPPVFGAARDLVPKAPRVDQCGR